MNRTALASTVIFTSALAASITAAPLAASAQCELREAHLTGDDSTSSVFSLTTSREDWLLGAFGIDRDDRVREDGWYFAREPGGLSTTDRNGSYRRLLNALLVLGAVNRGSETYQRWAADEICTLQPDPSTECGPQGANEYVFPSGQCHVSLTRTALRNRNVLYRAGVVVHEARHREVSHLQNRYESGETRQCEVPYSCDLSWTSGDGGARYGAQREEIVFWERATAQTSLFTPMVLAEVRESANFKLNTQFKYHPGFNLHGGTTFTRSAWSAEGTVGSGPDIEVAYQPDPMMPTRAVVGLGLRMRSDPTQGSRISTMRVHLRPVHDDGSLGDPTYENAGSEPDHGLEREVVLASGQVATGFAARAARPEDGDANITTLGLYARAVGADGLTGNQGFAWAPSSATGSIEVDQVATYDRFLTGVGFASRDANVTRWAWTGAARGPWTPYVGGDRDPMYNLACPLGQVAVGTVQNLDPSGLYIGYFGIVCAPQDTVEGGALPPEGARTVAHGSYDTGARVFQARLESWSQYLATRPGTASQNRVELCGAGDALRGLYVNAGALVDSVTHLTCTRLHGINAGLTSSRFVGYGGAGGAPRQSWCGVGRVVDGLFVRSNGYTTGFAFRCRQP